MRRKLILLIVVIYAGNFYGLLYGNISDDRNPIIESKSPITTEEIFAQFTLVDKNPNSFLIGQDLDSLSPPKKDKNYFRPFWDITKFNLLIWAFDRYFLKGPWTDISFESISKNIESGLTWDYDDFAVNQLGHAYHGAMFQSISRTQGMNFLESSIYTFLGSLTWEFFWESELPGKNDHIYSWLGGTNLGEALYRIASLINYQNATGLGRTLQMVGRFLINPIVGIIPPSKYSSLGYYKEKHDYNFKLPLGAFYSSDDQLFMLLATRFEFKDAFQNNSSKIHPYDWFSFDARIEFNKQGFRGPEISTYGILYGKKFQNACAGLFGLFDYINSYVANQMSAAGVGPGFATSSASRSNLFLNTSGILSFVFGSSSATIDYSEPNFEKEGNKPYHFGPGVLGRIRLELGKKGLGSIFTGFSQYWVNASLVDAKEFLSILSFELNVNMSERSQISLGYDYYLRHGDLEGQQLTRSRNALRAMYVLNF